MGDGWCESASPCPCGEWAMCAIYGEWVQREDCEECGDYERGDEDD